MGRVSKGAKCGIEGCDEDAVRSLAAKTVTFTEVTTGRGGRVYLCRAHYKAHKKRTGTARRVERWRWNV